jgi:hypothetical protein
VRVSNVRQLLKLPDGDFAVLNNGVKIPVARRRREAFLAAMNNRQTPQYINVSSELNSLIINYL